MDKVQCFCFHSEKVFETNLIYRIYIGTDGLISFHVVGRRMVIINSAAVAEDLLIRRPTIYSDRPNPTMGSKLIGIEKAIFML
jgi:hypothetical protein